MLSRVASLSILCVSLLFAGVPAIACATQQPAGNCCPDDPNAPCTPDSSSPAEANLAVACCVSGIAVSSAMVVAGSFDENQDHAKLSDPPSVVTSDVMSPALDRRPHFFPGSICLSSFNPSRCALYLSTGRLRL